MALRAALADPTDMELIGPVHGGDLSFVADPMFQRLLFCQWVSAIFVSLRQNKFRLHCLSYKK